MKPRAATLVLAIALVAVVVASTAAFAQVQPNPTVTPTRNDGGWINLVQLLMGAIALIVVLVIVVGYMRYAPRFAKDEDTLKVVRADRVLPGREAPRRAVDLSKASPVVVPPPALPRSAATAPAATATIQPAAAAAPEAPGPAAAPAPETPAPAAAPAPEAPAPRPAAPAPAPAAEERPEVSMDQEVFEQKLQELLDKGTDRRVAEGQARRAAMIAARQKASGGA
jgi:uncharacterized membrane protein